MSPEKGPMEFAAPNLLAIRGDISMLVAIFPATRLHVNTVRPRFRCLGVESEMAWLRDCYKPASPAALRMVSR